MTNHENQNGNDFTTVELRELQEWAAAPAAGEAKLEALAKPPLVRPQRKRRRRAYIYQAAAALVIFGAGYLAGNVRSQKAGSPPQPVIVAAPVPTAQRAPAPAPLPSATPLAVASAKLGSAPAPPTAASVPVQKNCESPQIYQGNDGRFRIDTVLCQSGSHATWVINPQLELANASHINTEEDKQ